MRSAYTVADVSDGNPARFQSARSVIMSGTRPATTESLADVNVSNVEEPDPTALPYGLRRMLDADVLSAGRGYWVEVPEDVVWTVTG